MLERVSNAFCARSEPFYAVYETAVFWACRDIFLVFEFCVVKILHKALSPCHHINKCRDRNFQLLDDAIADNPSGDNRSPERLYL